MTAAEATAAGFLLAVSVLPILAGHLIRGRGPRAQLLATATFALLGVGFGALLYVGRGRGVPAPQALGGAALAGGLMVALPAAIYLQLGYRVRLLGLALGVWVASTIPLVFYLFVLGLAVSSKVSCAPGEDCSPFS